MSAPGDERARQARLGEWACLGILFPAPAHGWAVAARLRPEGDVGRVWSLSRPLTYRALDALTERGLVEAVGSEPGAAGPNRTILALTRDGRAEFRRWVRTPVQHLRDLRSEMLLKLVLADLAGIDTAPMLAKQGDVVGRLATAWDRGADAPDVVALWRYESSQAALRFLDQLTRAGKPRRPHQRRTGVRR